VAPKTRPRPDVALAGDAASLPAAAFERVSSHGDRAAPNAVIRGDNLEVLERLGARADRGAAGPFRLVYVDPPYNTGRVFKEYRDARRPEDWRAMMRARLSLLPSLMSDDGTLVAEIDDTELGTLIVLLDEIFGRANRISIVTVLRSAPTGHKAINRGPVNVADYLLVYAKHRKAFRPNAVVCRRPRRDPAYSTVIVDRRAPTEAWRFEPLGRVVARELGFASRLAAVRALGPEPFESKLERFCLEHADRVVRFAQPRYEAVSLDARALIDRSKAEPERIFVLERAAHRPLILRGGNRVLFLADKVRSVGGERAFVEPLTNVWNDVPFQGLAREGSVTFSRNKKPERLLARLLELFTREGDWVLDPFLGSGTTAAVAQKMGRRWVGIESAHDLVEGVCIPRLTRVVDGDDDTGVSREFGARAGGGFGVYA
jgi:adenine-specific DNA-methyltransferase